MHLLLIATPAAAQGPSRDYRYLAACGELDRSDLALRDAGAAGFAGLLQSAGFGNGATRAAPASADFTGGALSIALTTRRRD